MASGLPSGAPSSFPRATPASPWPGIGPRRDTAGSSADVSMTRTRLPWPDGVRLPDARPRHTAPAPLSSRVSSRVSSLVSSGRAIEATTLYLTSPGDRRRQGLFALFAQTSWYPRWRSSQVDEATSLGQRSACSPALANPCRCGTCLDGCRGQPHESAARALRETIGMVGRQSVRGM